jgi:predicted  nucleic acid-binding Zn-ribbon protein
MSDEQVVQQFLGDRPAAEQLREWRSTLQQRLKAMKAERERLKDAPSGLDAKIAQLKKQIAALGEEEAITEFVEDSVRVTMRMGATTDEVASDEWT